MNPFTLSASNQNTRFLLMQGQSNRLVLESIAPAPMIYRSHDWNKAAEIMRKAS